MSTSIYTMYLNILRSQVVIHKLLLLETKDPFDNGFIKKKNHSSLLCISHENWRWI